MKENIEIIEEFLNECDKNSNDEVYLKCNGITKCAIKNIFFDYKRVLKENEELKAENNKLKVIKYDTNYGTETTNLISKSELVKINTNRYMIEIENGKFVDLKQVYQENEELKEKWDKDTHKLQNDLDIANAKRIDWEKAYQEEKDKQFELVRENQKLESENEELKKELGRVTYGRNQLFEYATAQQANPEMLHKILRVEYISKQKIKDILNKIEKRNYNNYTNEQNGNEIKNKILFDIQELLEKE